MVHNNIAFVNDPVEVLQEVIRKRYPEIKVFIIITQQFTDKVKNKSCTLIPIEDGFPFIIEINPNISVIAMANALIEEFARIMANSAHSNDEAIRIYRETKKNLNSLSAKQMDKDLNQFTNWQHMQKYAMQKKEDSGHD